MLKKLFLGPSGNQGAVFLIIFNALFLWVFFTFYLVYLDSPDMVESYAWGMSWALGNNKHPPLYSWITALWFQLFPTRNWAYYLLTEINLLIALVFLMLCMRKKLDANKTFISLALTVVVLPLGIQHGYQYNANYAQLPFLTGYLWALLKAIEGRRNSQYVLAGLFAGAALLCKYSAVCLLVPITLAVLVNYRLKLPEFFPRLAIIALAAFAVFSPHLYWEIQHHWPSMEYLQQKHPEIPIGQWFPIALERGYVILTYVSSSLGMLAIALALRPMPINNYVPATQIRSQLGLLIFSLSVLCTFMGSLLEKIRPDAAWFIVCTIFLGWALVEILPGRIQFSTLGYRIKILIIIYFSVVTIFSIYDKYTYKSPHVAFEALPEMLSGDVTKLYHDAYHKPIAYAAGSFPLPYDLSFYSPDHPRGIFALDLQGSTWIDADQFKRGSKVIVCDNRKRDFPKDPVCTDEAITLFGRPDSIKTLEYVTYDRLLKLDRAVDFHILMYR